MAVCPAVASDVSPSTVSVGENWLRMPASMAAWPSMSISWAVARVTAPTAANPCSNFPAALASDSEPATVRASAVNTANPRASCLKFPIIR